jgi:hypothetical protein
MATSIEMRRKIRALEARRDKLTETVSKSRSELAKVRAELKHNRGLKK